MIQVRQWHKSSYAQSGGKPQALLNEQFVNKCDAAVAMFWTRFGSPTDVRETSEIAGNHFRCFKMGNGRTGIL